MGKAGDQGPRKIDTSQKQEYKEISNSQANQAKEKTQQIMQKNKQMEESKDEQPQIDWRKGNFSEPKPQPKPQQQIGATLAD